jgi:hypothetical protein
LLSSTVVTPRSGWPATVVCSSSHSA